MKKFKELLLDKEIDLGQRELERERREEEKERIIFHLKDIVNQKNPLEIIINTLNNLDSFCKNGLIVLDEDYLIKGMTRTAKRIIGYRQKHGLPPCFNHNYTDLLYPEQIQEFKDYITKRKKGKETLQRIVVSYRTSGKTHIRSTILNYNITRKDSLYGIIIGWNGKNLFG